MRKFFLFLASLLLSASCLANVEINKATEAELDSVKGLGPAMTARIMKAREQALFKNWSDVLARVKGIKARTATQLSIDGLRVNGQAFPDNIN